MTGIRAMAQELANSCGARFWVVVPRNGCPYIAHSPAQIEPRYEQLITVLPASGYVSAWDPNNHLQ